MKKPILSFIAFLIMHTIAFAQERQVIVDTVYAKKAAPIKETRVKPGSKKQPQGIKAEHLPTVQENLITSTSIAGFWRMVYIVPDGDGTVKKIPGNDYKIYNTDGTVFTFITWFNKGVHRKGSQELQYGVTDIGFYGTYEITSDSTLTETLVKQALKPNDPPHRSDIRYRLVSPNELLILWNNNGKWVPEMWERVRLAEIPNVEGKTNLSGEF